MCKIVTKYAPNSTFSACNLQKCFWEGAQPPICRPHIQLTVGICPSHTYTHFNACGASVFAFRPNSPPPNLIPLAYTFNVTAGWLAELIASAFNQLCQYANSPGNGILIRRTRRFYRAMHSSAKHGIAIACRPSVCPSVCLWRWWIRTT